MSIVSLLTREALR